MYTNTLIQILEQKVPELMDPSHRNNALGAALDVIDGRNRCRFGFDHLVVYGKVIPLSDAWMHCLVDDYRSTFTSVVEDVANCIFYWMEAPTPGFDELCDDPHHTMTPRELEIWAWQQATRAIVEARFLHEDGEIVGVQCRFGEESFWVPVDANTGFVVYEYLDEK